MPRRLRRRTSPALAFVAAITFLVTSVVVAGGPAGAAAFPSAPRHLSVLAGDGSATVRWTPPASSGSAPLSGYIVSAYVGKQVVKTAVIGKVTSYVMPGLKNAHSYQFRVWARNANGRGTPATTSVVTVGAPTPPRTPSATRGVRSATVHWVAPSAENGSPVTGYLVVPYLDGHPQGSRSFGAAATSGVVAGLAVGRTYKFLVSARNGNGLGLPSRATGPVNPTSTLHAKAPPPAEGYFPTLAPGAKLPSEASCDGRVKYSNWEPRPNNSLANHRTPKRPLVVRKHPDFNATWNSKFRPRVTGNFTGTTDEIIQWAACKWGLSDEMLRAESVDESNWSMNVESDFENRANGHCTRGDHRNPCPTSFGILQIKWYYNPDANPTNNSYPMSKNMTAFSLDYTAAMLRGCYEGWEYFGSKSRGDLWGCMGAWYSGDWHDSGANAYIERVQHFYNTKPWRNWAG